MNKINFREEERHGTPYFPKKTPADSILLPITGMMK